MEAPRTPRIPSLPTLGARDLLRLLPRPGGPARAAFPLDHLDPRHPDRAPLYYLARNALYHGLRALGVGPGHDVLMPAYHHGVEVETVRHTGARVLYYRVDRHFLADLDHLRARLADAPRARVLYLTHVAGFAQPVADALALCRERGLLLVEDCALSLFSANADGRPLGSSGDLALFCLYKSLPVPHGGLAVLRGGGRAEQSRSRSPSLPSLPSLSRSSSLPTGAPPPLLATLHHVAGSLLARDELRAGRRPSWEALRRLSRRTVDRVAAPLQVGTMHLRPVELHLGASALVPRWLDRVDAPSLVVRRRRNYHRLLASLGESRCLLPGPLPPGTNPLFFPLVVEAKREAHQALVRRGVEAVDFWSTGAAEPRCDDAEFADAAWLRRRVLELPIHQDLDDEAIDVVARAVKLVLRRA